ncbi:MULTISPECIES: hypothetical protein [unclassified Winogradskyella]|uniref:hypothetical protein n=1 Tax=unclassified Winogradskyella TaxID=2615021 RepID=UPI0012F724A2|nr:MULTISPECIES: hypothetical protein [unclassified Winogradskyella]
MKEGTDITVGHSDVLFDISKTYFGGKQFVYISNRINSYSVNPNVYKKINEIENLAGFAVVSYGFKTSGNVKIEQLYFDKPIEVFDNINDAKEWAKSVVKNLT